MFIYLITPLKAFLSHTDHYVTQGIKLLLLGFFFALVHAHGLVLGLSPLSAYSLDSVRIVVSLMLAVRR